MSQAVGQLGSGAARQPGLPLSAVNQLLLPRPSPFFSEQEALELSTVRLMAFLCRALSLILYIFHM